MSDSFEFTLHSPLTKEDWEKLLDAEHEKTKFVTFQTPQGKQVKYIKCEVLDKIRAEMQALADIEWNTKVGSVSQGLEAAIEIIDNYAESEE